MGRGRIAGDLPDWSVTEDEHRELRWILLFVRLVVAAVMLFYGLPKIRDLKSNTNDFVEMGFRPGIFWEH